MLASQYFPKCHKMPLSTWHNKHGQKIIFLPKLHSPIVSGPCVLMAISFFCVAKLKLWFLSQLQFIPNCQNRLILPADTTKQQASTLFGLWQQPAFNLFIPFKLYSSMLLFRHTMSIYWDLPIVSSPGMLSKLMSVVFLCLCHVLPILTATADLSTWNCRV